MFQLKKTLVVQSPNEENNDDSIEASSEDITYDESRGLKVTLMQHCTPAKAQDSLLSLMHISPMISPLLVSSIMAHKRI